MPDLDRPRDVRLGEELDVPALSAWLREALGIAETPTVRQYPSGFSNLTYLLEAGERRLVLRRPPLGKHVRGGHDMGREFRLLTALAGHVPVPRALGFEPTGSVLGAPFYVMEHVEGVILRAGSDPEAPPPETMAHVAGAFVATLGGFARGRRPKASGWASSASRRATSGARSQGWARRYAACSDGRRSPTWRPCLRLDATPTSRPSPARRVDPQRRQVR